MTKELYSRKNKPCCDNGQASELDGHPLFKKQKTRLQLYSQGCNIAFRSQFLARRLSERLCRSFSLLVGEPAGFELLDELQGIEGNGCHQSLPLNHTMVHI